MKKIPTVFERDTENMALVLDKINPECQWVFDGEGVATRKYDGACCAIIEGRFYKRREFTDLGRFSAPWPDDFILTWNDPVSRKCTGWVPVDESTNDQWFREGLANYQATYGCIVPDGTYELVGPKVQGNPEGFKGHVLLRHGLAEYSNLLPKRNFGVIREFLEPMDIEGLVFHHPDGRMGKIKKRDFGLNR